MSITSPAHVDLVDQLRDLARRLDNAPHTEKGDIVNQFAKLSGWSRGKIYRQLKKIGWSSGRARRSDCGRTSQDPATLKAVAASLRLGVRKNGKATMHTPVTRSILSRNGHEFTVGNARINTLLRQHKMNLVLQQQAPAYQPQRSLHPNHVHLVDPSLCLVYYLPDGGQAVISDDEAYKNKPENIERIADLKVWRYVLVDHYSGTVVVRYYQARGETQANLFDFLLYCWRRLEGRPFHGVPLHLYWDKGSANTAGAIKNALRALEVQTLEHLPGNPRAKGSVEWANNLVECNFESRLKFEPVRNVDELNAAAEAWCIAYNSNTIPAYDSRLFRRGMREPMSRFGVWQRIRKEQLRILPDPDVCRYLLSNDPQERTVKPDLTISFKHPASKRALHYDLRDLPNVHPRCKVRVSPLVYGDDEVVVYVDQYDGDERTFICKPIEFDEFSGFRMDAAIIGEEHKRPPETSVERAGKDADRLAYPGLDDDQVKRAKANNAAPFGGGIDAHSHLHQVAPPAYLDRPGTDLDIPDRAVVEQKPLSHIQACKRLVAALGRPLTPDENARIRDLYPAGVPEEDVSTLLAQLRGQPTTPSTKDIRIVK